MILFLYVWVWCIHASTVLRCLKFHQMDIWGVFLSSTQLHPRWGIGTAIPSCLLIRTYIYNPPGFNTLPMNHESPPEILTEIHLIELIVSRHSKLCRCLEIYKNLGKWKWWDTPWVSIQSSVTWKVRVQGDQNMTCRLVWTISTNWFWSNLWTAKTC